MEEHYSREELLKALNSDRLYDYIANHYWEMTKEELKDVLLEVIYACQKPSDIDNISESLEERWDMSEPEKPTKVIVMAQYLTCAYSTLDKAIEDIDKVYQSTTVECPDLYALLCDLRDAKDGAVTYDIDESGAWVFGRPGANYQGGRR